MVTGRGQGLGANRRGQSQQQSVIKMEGIECVYELPGIVIMLFATGR